MKANHSSGTTRNLTRWVKIPNHPELVMPFFVGYGTKEAAFEAAMVAASFSVRDGDGVQVSVPSDARLNDVEQTEPWPKEWNAFLKR